VDPVSEHERSGENAVAEVLAAAANPSLFRANAFRVVELPADASARDAMRQADKLKMMGKLGGQRPPGPGAVLRLDPLPDGDAVRAAGQRLNDPLRRLVDEIFWFSPIGAGAAQSDAALEALTRGDSTAAAELWAKQRKSKGEAAFLATHNLAVLSHALALDFEHESERGSLSAEKQERRAACWKDAYRLWKELVEEEGFWDFVGGRIRALDDARLTAAASRKIRSTLPAAILGINAKLALAAAERQQWAETERQLGIARASGFADVDINAALQDATAPVLAHIRTYCEECKQQGGADFERADTFVDRLLGRAAPGLEILDRLLPADQPTRVSGHDETALTALEAAIGFGNKTKKWTQTLNLMERIRPLAVSPSARSRIDENLAIIRTNAEQQGVWGTCWFCGTSVPDDNVAIKRSYYKVISQIGNTIQYRQSTVSVPRCASCAEAQTRAARFDDRKVSFMFSGGVFGLVGGFGAYRIVDVLLGSGFLGFVLLVLCAGGYGYLARILVLDNYGHEALPSGIKSSGSCIQFPPIKELVTGGWSPGEKPPTTS
jgi:hypothetical protein